MERVIKVLVLIFKTHLLGSIIVDMLTWVILRKIRESWSRVALKTAYLY